MTRQRVVVVTGGGGGIGAAIAEELGRQGAFVLTMDPLVTLDGTEAAPTSEETTADRIVAAGGSARASSVSVTDRDAVAGLFAALVEELGGLDAVVNVAGITRPTSFARGSEADWRAVLEVHLAGYLNVLAAALPIMAAARHGHLLGVTSGSGWRAADTGAYGCAKRAVAAITWELGRRSPPGVVVNAVSPIAVTRMVTAALSRIKDAGGAATGGLSLGSMPAPEELGPIGAHLVSDGFDACRGRVLFAAGSEVALIDEPRLLEVVRTDDVSSLAHVLETAAIGALGPAEAQQASNGGSNPRFVGIFDATTDGDLPCATRTCAVVADRPDVASAVTAALEARGVTCTTISEVAPGVDAAAVALSAAVMAVGPLDAVVLARSGALAASESAADWERVLAEHDDIVGHIHADAAWARAVADHAAAADRPVRLLTLTDATTAGGRSRAQAAAQHARAARGATSDRVLAFAVSLEAPVGQAPSVGELIAHLLCSPGVDGLSGAELVAGPGWVGLRSHPRPLGSVTFGGPEVPAWLDATLQEMTGR